MRALLILTVLIAASQEALLGRGERQANESRPSAEVNPREGRPGEAKATRHEATTAHSRTHDIVNTKANDDSSGDSSTALVIIILLIVIAILGIALWYCRKKKKKNKSPDRYLEKVVLDKESTDKSKGKDEGFALCSVKCEKAEQKPQEGFAENEASPLLKEAKDFHINEEQIIVHDDPKAMDNEYHDMENSTLSANEERECIASQINEEKELIQNSEASVSITIPDNALESEQEINNTLNCEDNIHDCEDTTNYEKPSHEDGVTGSREETENVSQYKDSSCIHKCSAKYENETKDKATQYTEQDFANSNEIKLPVSQYKESKPIVSCSVEYKGEIQDQGIQCKEQNTDIVTNEECFIINIGTNNQTGLNGTEQIKNETLMEVESSEQNQDIGESNVAGREDEHAYSSTKESEKSYPNNGRVIFSLQDEPNKQGKKSAGDISDDTDKTHISVEEPCHKRVIVKHGERQGIYPVMTNDSCISPENKDTGSKIHETAGVPCDLSDSKEQNNDEPNPDYSENKDKFISISQPEITGRINEKTTDAVTCHGSPDVDETSAKSKPPESLNVNDDLAIKSAINAAQTSSSSTTNKMSDAKDNYRAGTAGVHPHDEIQSNVNSVQEELEKKNNKDSQIEETIKIVCCSEEEKESFSGGIHTDHKDTYCDKTIQGETNLESKEEMKAPLRDVEEQKYTLDSKMKTCEDEYNKSPMERINEKLAIDNESQNVTTNSLGQNDLLNSECETSENEHKQSTMVSSTENILNVNASQIFATDPQGLSITEDANQTYIQDYNISDDTDRTHISVEEPCHKRVIDKHGEREGTYPVMTNDPYISPENNDTGSKIHETAGMSCALSESKEQSNDEPKNKDFENIGEFISISQPEATSKFYEKTTDAVTCHGSPDIDVTSDKSTPPESLTVNDDLAIKSAINAAQTCSFSTTNKMSDAEDNYIAGTEGVQPHDEIQPNVNSVQEELEKKNNKDSQIEETTKLVYCSEEGKEDFSRGIHTDHKDTYRDNTNQGETNLESKEEMKAPLRDVEEQKYTLDSKMKTCEDEYNKSPMERINEKLAIDNESQNDTTYSLGQNDLLNSECETSENEHKQSTMVSSTENILNVNESQIFATDPQGLSITEDANQTYIQDYNISDDTDRTHILVEQCHKRVIIKHGEREGTYPVMTNDPCLILENKDTSSQNHDTAGVPCDLSDSKEQNNDKPNHDYSISQAETTSRINEKTTNAVTCHGSPDIDETSDKSTPPESLNVNDDLATKSAINAAQTSSFSTTIKMSDAEDNYIAGTAGVQPHDEIQSNVNNVQEKLEEKNNKDSQIEEINKIVCCNEKGKEDFSRGIHTDHNGTYHDNKIQRETNLESKEEMKAPLRDVEEQKYTLDSETETCESPMERINENPISDTESQNLITYSLGQTESINSELKTNVNEHKQSTMVSSTEDLLNDIENQIVTIDRQEITVIQDGPQTYIQDYNISDDTDRTHILVEEPCLKRVIVKHGEREGTYPVMTNDPYISPENKNTGSKIHDSAGMPCALSESKEQNNDEPKHDDFGDEDECISTCYPESPGNIKERTTDAIEFTESPNVDDDTSTKNNFTESLKDNEDQTSLSSINEMYTSSCSTTMKLNDSDDNDNTLNICTEQRQSDSSSRQEELNIHEDIVTSNNDSNISSTAQTLTPEIHADNGCPPRDINDTTSPAEEWESGSVTLEAKSPIYNETEDSPSTNADRVDDIQVTCVQGQERLSNNHEKPEEEYIKLDTHDNNITEKVTVSNTQHSEINMEVPHPKTKATLTDEKATTDYNSSTKVHIVTGQENTGGSTRESKCMEPDALRPVQEQLANENEISERQYVSTSETRDKTECAQEKSDINYEIKTVTINPKDENYPNSVIDDSSIPDPLPACKNEKCAVNWSVEKNEDEQQLENNKDGNKAEAEKVIEDSSVRAKYDSSNTEEFSETQSDNSRKQEESTAQNPNCNIEKEGQRKDAETKSEINTVNKATTYGHDFDSDIHDQSSESSATIAQASAIHDSVVLTNDNRQEDNMPKKKNDNSTKCDISPQNRKSRGKSKKGSNSQNVKSLKRGITSKESSKEGSSLTGNASSSQGIASSNSSRDPNSQEDERLHRKKRDNSNKRRQKQKQKAKHR
ncbi:hypothetical protein SK128_008858 [Halocaridina rubra]|uniref:Uncharacterized protein n=1 Tax=Halocaridina rubra TaxID=373956 RepID=A0AAN8X6U5_HALRR